MCLLEEYRPYKALHRVNGVMFASILCNGGCLVAHGGGVLVRCAESRGAGLLPIIASSNNECPGRTDQKMFRMIKSSNMVHCGSCSDQRWNHGRILMSGRYDGAPASCNFSLLPSVAKDLYPAFPIN